MKVFQLQLTDDLFQQVQGHMETGLKRPVSEEEVSSLLARNVDLLGSIVHYNEVDTEDRYRIWDLCKSND